MKTASRICYALGYALGTVAHHVLEWIGPLAIPEPFPQTDYVAPIGFPPEDWPLPQHFSAAPSRE